MTDEARRAYMAAWYQRNKERLGIERKEYLARYYQSHKERASAAGRAYRDANKARISESRRQYRQSDRGKATYAAWRAENGDKIRASKARSRGNSDPNKRRNRDFLQKYGISLGDYDRMFEEQGGLCAICFGPPNSGRRMVVDHNHETGEVRGLLCNTCNLAIGHLKDDPVVVASAFAYLEVTDA